MMNQKLQDVQNGKERPWKEKKIKTLILSNSFHRLGSHKKANRVWWCSDQLGFLKNLETGQKVLDSANFCRERLCPLCQWRKSLKVFHEVSNVMDYIQQEYDNLVPLFLTLTVKNCTKSELQGVLDMIFKGWYQFRKHRKIRETIHGWFRALEITYNKQDHTYHPHIHAIILVEKDYFKKGNKDYMHTTDWVKLWRTAMKLDYDPICDIRKVKEQQGQYKAIAEVAKYTLKDSEFLQKDDQKLTDELVSTLSDALHHRRLYAFGGVFQKVAKQLKMDQLDEGDLIQFEKNKMREDVATMLEIYRWNFGMTEYIRE